MNNLERRILRALDIALNYSQIDGGHHKAWVIDQMVRALTGSKLAEGEELWPVGWDEMDLSKDCYSLFIASHNAGEDGPNTYSWDEGIAP